MANQTRSKLIAAAALALAGFQAFSATPGKALPTSGAKPIDFVRDIRPILSDNCFACHGQDDKQRKSKLRLDVRDAAIQPAKSGDIAIVPGDLAKSKLIERITSHDPDEKPVARPLREIDVVHTWLHVLHAHVSRPVPGARRTAFASRGRRRQRPRVARVRREKLAETRALVAARAGARDA